MSTYTDASLIYYPSGYKAGTAYSLKPTDGSGDLTFTRASTATRVNESGLIESVATGVPRIDYTGGGCGKLLLEPQRTNLAIESETFISWIDGFGSVTLNVATSPDGTTNAASYKDNNTGGTGEVLRYKQINVDAASAYTFSIFFKSSGLSQWAYLQATDYNGTIDGFAYFDILNGVVGINSNLSSTNIENYGDGWYRCSITFIQGVGDTQVRSQFQVVGGNGTKNVTRNGTNGYYVWGAQTEKGSYATSYIPTTSTAVTRVRDSASKTPISSFLNTANPFTFYLNFQRAEGTTPASYQLIGLDNGGYGEYIKLINKSAQLKFYIQIRNSTTSATSADITNTPNIKIAIVYDGATSYKIFHNGALLQTLTLGACSLNRFASGENGIQFTTESYSSIMLFPTALSDTDAIALTTL